MNISEILAALNAHQTRATYGAVGELLGIAAIGVGRHLGQPRAEASWVVSATTEKPTGYNASDYHPDLLSHDKIIRTGNELRGILTGHPPAPDTSQRSGPVPAGEEEFAKVRMVRPAASSSAQQLAGIDLAWMGEKNGSGIAIDTLSDRQLRVEEIHCGIIGLDGVQSILANCQALCGVAIDAPLIIGNTQGARPCEKELTAVYNARWAGCYPSSLTRFPDASSVKLANWLSGQDFSHMGEGNGDRWQIECYPHPAIIELFGLDRRLKYKKGSLGEKRHGQAQLAEHIRSLEVRSSLALKIPNAFDHRLDAGYIESLRGQRLKDNEDALDALICLYIGGQYASGQEMTIFGEDRTGYIVVPKSV